jgi:predicted RecA/RadA family phage recombinase
MAANEVYNQGDFLPLTVGASVAAGSPVCVGQLPGVTVTATGSSGTQNATVCVKNGAVFNLSVKAVDGGGNSAVSVGDIIYWVVGDTPKLSKKNTGVKFGIALQAITSGSTATIPVRLST